MTDNEFFMEFCRKTLRAASLKLKVSRPDWITCYEENGFGHLCLVFDGSSYSEDKIKAICQFMYDASLMVGIPIRVFRYHTRSQVFTSNQELVAQFNKETT